MCCSTFGSTLDDEIKKRYHQDRWNVYPVTDPSPQPKNWLKARRASTKMHNFGLIYEKFAFFLTWNQ